MDIVNIPVQWRGINFTTSGASLKSLEIDGFPGYLDGIVVGIHFAHENTHAEPNLNISGTSGLLGNRQMWNENGRIGAGNQVLVAGRVNVFIFNETLSRWMWLGVLAEEEQAGGGITARIPLIDEEMKPKITTVATSSIKPWSNLYTFKQIDLETLPKIATFEHNFWVLDGTFEIMPDVVPEKDWGFWSDTASSLGSGTFSSSPSLDIRFSNHVSTKGLTLEFYGQTNDYVDRVRVAYYRGTSLLDYSDYINVGADGLIRSTMDDYDRVRIEFVRTNIRYRFAKIKTIHFGIVYEFKDSEIDSCRILEEIDPTIASVSSNRLDLTVGGRSELFKPITHPDYNDLKDYPIEIKKDGKHYGKFYVVDWSDPTKSGLRADITALDAISLLDRHQFFGSVYGDNEQGVAPFRENRIKLVLSSIFDVVFPNKTIWGIDSKDKPVPFDNTMFELDPSLEDIELYGWIPNGTCGFALQQVLFAIGAVADCSRRNNIWIYPRELYDSETATGDKRLYKIPIEKQYRGGQDRLRETVSRATVVEHSFRRPKNPGLWQNGGWGGVASDNALIKEFFRKEEAVQGDVFTVVLDRPCFRIRAETVLTGIIDYKVQTEPRTTNFVRVELPNAQRPSDEKLELSVFAVEYIHNTNTVSKVIGFSGLEKKYENFTLVNSENVDKILGDLTLFLSKRITTKNDVVFSGYTVENGKIADLEVGYYGIVETRANPVRGIITSLDINLRGNRAIMEVIGDVMD